ncbi:putative anaphase-promoting complex subunit cdc20-like [Capsicum annuum]|nr:putative anaphase-promoting complex subunit cdc20-like [Capsicum annuum]
MGSSETESGNGDCGVGSIVWVRRRNGSWWPGKILCPDELSASHLMAPRSGTPVKLLGREDAMAHPKSVSCAMLENGTREFPGLVGLGKILIHPHERFTWGIIKLVLVDSEAGLSQKNVAKLEEFATHTERVLTKPAINLKLSHQEWTVPLAKDWYNLEKSKRVKAFRCGEFDDFIQRAEASLGMPPKKREKYARREDAILHALELERLSSERCGSLGGSSTDKTTKSMYDFSGREPQTSSRYLGNGNGRRLRSKSRQLSHNSGLFLEEKGTCNFSSIQESKDHNRFSGDDEDSDVPPRMRGLQDLGLSTAPSEHNSPPSIASDVGDRPVLGRSADAVPDGIYNSERLVNTERKSLSVKRKLSDEGLAKEILVKRRDRSLFLAQVLRNAENLPDSGSVCISEMGEEQPGVAKKSRCNLADPTESLTIEESNHAQMELSTLKCEDNGFHPAELCEQNASGSAEYTETYSTETDSAEDTDDELATISGFSLLTLAQATLHVHSFSRQNEAASNVPNLLRLYYDVSNLWNFEIFGG